LSQPGSSSLVVENQNILIVTDFASNLDKVEQLVKKLDRVRPGGRIELVPVEHANAIDLADRLQKLLSARSTMRTVGGFVSGKSEITVSVDERTNQSFADYWYARKPSARRRTDQGIGCGRLKRTKSNPFL